MMDTVLTVLAASLVGALWGQRPPQVNAFRLAALAWYTRKRAVWVEVIPVEGVWTVGSVSPHDPFPSKPADYLGRPYSRFHRVEVDLSWFGVLPDSAWRAECERARDMLKLTRVRLDQLRTALATALDAHPASTSDELLDELAKRDLSPWTEEVPTAEGHYLVARAPADKQEATPEVELWRFSNHKDRGLATSIAWSKLWPGQRVAFRRLDVDSRVWVAPSWSESAHQRRVDELLAASNAANAAFLAAMDEEAAHRARVEEAKRLKDEAFKAWEDELLREPGSKT